MSRLKIDGIIAIVRGYTTNNGLPYFQRSVPPDLRSRVGKATIKIPLKRENGHFAVQCHRLNLKYDALFKALRKDPALVPSELKLAAYALLESSGLSAGDGSIPGPRPDGYDGPWDEFGHADAFVDHLEDVFGKPNSLTRTAIKALHKPLPVLLSECLSVYLDNHKNGSDKVFAEKQQAHWDKLINLVGDIGAESLNREHARKYRAHRLACGVTPSTVQREINVIRAVINVARREIPLNINNPFESLSIPAGEEESTTRAPYSKDEVLELVGAARSINDERRRIVIVLAVTGARLAEIVGLRRSDVDLINGTISIKAHKSRSLKTKASNRVVPLLPIALEALRQQLTEHDSEFVFPSYAKTSGANANSASAALNKWAQGLVEGKTMHSFRHSMRDFLRAVMCPESVTKEIGGWSGTHDISVQYGQGYPIEVKREYLSKAYAWLK